MEWFKKKKKEASISIYDNHKLEEEIKEKENEYTIHTGKSIDDFLLKNDVKEKTYYEVCKLLNIEYHYYHGIEEGTSLTIPIILNRFNIIKPGEVPIYVNMELKMINRQLIVQDIKKIIIN